MSLSSVFNQRQQSFLHQAEHLSKYLYQLSLLRLGIFLTLIALVWFGRQWPWWLLLISGVLVLIGFIIVVKKHQNTARKVAINKAITKINEDEAQRLNLKFTRTDNGHQFAVSNHAYGTDLDLFGPQSVFALINRAYTHIGMQTLANWLLKPADMIEISVRQEAIRELTPQIEWRQAIQAVAQIEKNIATSTNFLYDWLKTPPYIGVQKWQHFRWLPIFTIAIMVLAFMGIVAWGFPILLLLIHGYILAKIRVAVKVYAEESEKIIATLQSYGFLLEKIENHSFKADKLRALQNQLKIPQKASVQLKILYKLTSNLNFRLNPYFMLAVGVATLWDLQWMIELEKWKKHNKSYLKQWLDVLGEVEALNSLAGFAFANPTYTFADIAPQPLVLDAKSVGHLLIGVEHRKTNDFEVDGIGQTTLITGSNMSGKSTFLRTIGINWVLAMAGSVVCATQFRCSLVRLFTSMRTQDSLAENTSSFYAELKRLKLLLEQANTGGAPVFYFLDEILKGTNSADRHKGAVALIKQLSQLNASGFVSTHDLELGAIENQFSFLKNYSFYSTLASDGKLNFDYQLQTGVCEEANATALMRQIGINITNEDENPHHESPQS